MYTLLFVDDDTRLLEANRIYFTKYGFTVLTAETGTAALELVRTRPLDCVVLDILMPEQTGYELCKQLKEQSTAPIIFLTSLTEQENLYQGFMQGGDDYMTKPYEFRELELRINARINQSKGFLRQGELLKFPPLIIDVTGRQAQVGGKLVSLTSNEFDILVLLARTPGAVFSMNSIYREIWQQPDLETVHTVRVLMGRLRQKLELACPERAYIQTVWGKGYRFIGAENGEEKEETVTASS